IDLADLCPDHNDLRRNAPGECSSYRRQQMVNTKLVQTILILRRVYLVHRETTDETRRTTRLERIHDHNFLAIFKIIEGSKSRSPGFKQLGMCGPIPLLT